MRRRSIRVIECVSYRCLLRLVPCISSGAPKGPVRGILIQPAVETTHVSPIQQLQCVLPIGSIDARKTIVSSLRSIVSRSPLALNLVQVTGAVAFAASFIAAIAADYSRYHDASPSSSTIQLIAVALTAAYTVASATMYLRQVYKVLPSSFDFLYVSTLLTVVHVTACDFFQWHSSPCLVVLTSWLWIHWVLCIDALSPVVKDAFRLHVRFPAVVIAMAMAALIVLLYRMIVLDASEPLYNRVLWSGTVFRNSVAFRVMPTFIDSAATVFVWPSRLLYRAWRFDSDMRIVLDGPVAYTNYLSRLDQQRLPPRERVVSTHWKGSVKIMDGSILSAVAVTPVKVGSVAS